MNNTPKIMIVDDDAITREVLADYLMGQNVLVDFASSGSEALSKVASVNPDVMLLDVMMPGMSGFEVCRQLRADSRWRNLPIILVTALDSRSDMLEGLEAGADDFLTKPVNGPELRARVRTMLRIKEGYDALHSALKLRQDLSEMIVHDMKNPLATLLLYSDLLRLGGSLSEKQGSFLQVMRAQITRLNSFVNDLLLVAKSDSGRLVVKPEVVEVRDLIATNAEGYVALAEANSVSFRTVLPDEPLPVSLDSDLFTRVVDNLVSNAIKFSPEDSEIVLELARCIESGEGQPMLCLRIIDEGPGIPADERENIFEKFQIVDLKLKGVAQTGLGLAFCKMAVNAHGGRIYVSDNQPKGSIFTVEI